MTDRVVHHSWQVSPKSSTFTGLIPWIPFLGRWPQGQQGSGVSPAVRSPPPTWSWGRLPLSPRSAPAPPSSPPSDSGSGGCPHPGHPLPRSPPWWCGPWWEKERAGVIADAAWQLAAHRRGTTTLSGPAAVQGACCKGHRPCQTPNGPPLSIFTLKKVIGPHGRKRGRKRSKQVFHPYTTAEQIRINLLPSRHLPMHVFYVERTPSYNHYIELG